MVSAGFSILLLNHRNFNSFHPLLNHCLPIGRLSPEEGKDFSPSHFREDLTAFNS